MVVDGSNEGEGESDAGKRGAAPETLDYACTATHLGTKDTDNDGIDGFKHDAVDLKPYTVADHGGASPSAVDSPTALSLIHI